MRRPQSCALPALRAGGYVLAEAAADGRVLTTVPVKHNPATELTIRAHIVAAGDSNSRVVLSGIYDIASPRVRAEPVTPATRGVKREMWQRLERLAAAIRGQP